MYVLAITGGMGSGKSTAADLFEALGAVVVRLDELSSRLIGPGGLLVDEVLAAFGGEVRGAEGGIDHAKLARLAFASPASARKLDNIVHPGVYAAVAGALDALIDLPEPPKIVIVDIPLLVEAPMFFDLFDGVLVISASEDVRVARLEARGMAPDDIRARLALQVSDSERRAVADYVIENDHDKLDFEAALVRLWDEELASRGA